MLIGVTYEVIEVYIYNKKNETQAHDIVDGPSGNLPVLQFWSLFLDPFPLTRSMGLLGRGNRKAANEGQGRGKSWQ